MTESQENPNVTEWLPEFREMARELGFVKLGIAPAVDSAGFTDLVNWIDQGYAAGMSYFEDRIDAYRHPSGVMPGSKSVIVLAYPYPADSASICDGHHGRVARYAWSGVDYHDTIHKKLKLLKRFIQDAAPSVRTRGCIDTAPMMERELAQLAGIGWRGKNTLLINRERGSYLFLACVLLDIELPYDSPHQNSHCGTCTACLDAGPTDACPEPGVLDAARCISYLTIEHREAIPTQLRDGIGQWAFGCDVCQEVCPWNRKPARRASVRADAPPFEQVNLVELFSMTEDEFRSRFRKSPFWRTRLRGMQRNAAIVLGNKRDRSALAALRLGVQSGDRLVSEACHWAITKITDGAHQA